MIAINHKLCLRFKTQKITNYYNDARQSTNDITIGWQNLNWLSHTNAILAPQARQARASGENLNYILAESLV